MSNEGLRYLQNKNDFSGPKAFLMMYLFPFGVVGGGSFFALKSNEVFNEMWQSVGLSITLALIAFFFVALSRTDMSKNR